MDCKTIQMEYRYLNNSVCFLFTCNGMQNSQTDFRPEKYSNENGFN